MHNDEQLQVACTRSADAPSNRSVEYSRPANLNTRVTVADAVHLAASLLELRSGAGSEFQDPFAVTSAKLDQLCAAHAPTQKANPPTGITNSRMTSVRGWGWTGGSTTTPRGASLLDGMAVRRRRDEKAIRLWNRLIKSTTPYRTAVVLPDKTASPTMPRLRGTTSRGRHSPGSA